MVVFLYFLHRNSKRRCLWTMTCVVVFEVTTFSFIYSLKLDDGWIFFRNTEHLNIMKTIMRNKLMEYPQIFVDYSLNTHT